MKADSLPQPPIKPPYVSVTDGDIWLYFIQQKSGGPVNVGGTRNVKRRLADLQAACPDELRLMACVLTRPSMEIDIHALLAPIRIRTKWFKETELIQNLMHAARKDGASGISRIIRENFYLKD